MLRRAAALTYPHLLAAYLDDKWRNRAHTRLIGTRIAQAIQRPGARLAVITPPQVGKSSLCSIWLPVWLLARDASTKIITTSYGQQLATRNGRATRDLVRDHGRAFGVELARGSAAASEWYTTRGGGVKAAGVGAGITGFAADVLFVDDVYKDRADAESAAVRSGVWEWLSSSALTRLSPGAPVVMVGTLWTEQDPILRLIDDEGRVEDGGRWDVVHLPAIADSALTPYGDPLGRADGEPITHPRISDEDMEARRRHWADKKAGVLARDWESLYQGNPSPREGSLVAWELLHEATVPLERVPDAVRVVVAVDPSGGGADEVGIVVARLGTDGCCYITHDASEQMPVTEWPRVVCDLAEEHEADRIVLETNFGGKLSVQPIRTAWRGRERSCVMPAITVVRAKRGKVLRAEPIAQEMVAGRVWIAAGLSRLMRQWATYRPGSESPGRLDASVYAAINLLRPAVGTLVSSDDTGGEEHRPRRRDQVRSQGRRIPGR